MARSAPDRTDPLLLGEIVLALLLIGLSIFLYLRPVAADRPPEWWHWILLAGLFFGIVALQTRRKRQSSRRALHEVIREDAANPPG